MQLPTGYSKYTLCTLIAIILPGKITCLLQFDNKRVLRRDIYHGSWIIKIYEALESPVPRACQELDYVSDRAEINIMIDPQIRERLEDEQITLKRRRMRVRRLIRQIARYAGLRYRITPDGIVLE